jgi:pyruvate dehydrogenase E1 component alpha subunit
MHEAIKTTGGVTELPAELCKELYTSMLRIRIFEEKIVEVYPAQEMKCPVHLCIGQEAIPAGVAANLAKEDYLFSNHRGHGHALAKGTSMRSLMAEFYGRTTGCSRGKGGSMHLVDVANGILGTSAIVGGGIPMGVGTALASSIRGDGRISVVFFGDGAFDEGVFFESFNFAALKKLPVVFVCENNLYATNSHQSARQATCRISHSAAAFDSPGACIDGNDVIEVYNAAREAVERARAGHGPYLIEAMTYRWKGHVGPETDFEKGCRPEEELREWIKKCPVERFKEALTGKNILTDEEFEEIAATISGEVEDAVEFALSCPLPDASELLTDLYCEPEE